MANKANDRQDSDGCKKIAPPLSGAMFFILRTSVVENCGKVLEPSPKRDRVTVLTSSNNDSSGKSLSGLDEVDRLSMLVNVDGLDGGVAFIALRASKRDRQAVAK